MQDRLYRTDVAMQTMGYFYPPQLGGTLPAPLFLFLAGVSFALVIDKLIRKNLAAGEIARNMFRRGAEIFGFGLLLRLQEYLISWGWAPWSDLFRVDILNMIGLSMMLMALACGIALRFAGAQRRASLITLSIFVATVISLLTPLLWTNWRPSAFPWQIESYINGVHNLGVPQPWLFPIFPWAAFAFAGLAAGCANLDEKLITGVSSGRKPSAKEMEASFRLNWAWTG